MSDNLSNTATAVKAVRAVIMLADPDKNPGSVYVVDERSTVEWKSDSPKYPGFEIVFVGKNPAQPGDKLLGSTKHPVKIHVKTPGNYKYKVRHIKKDGKKKTTGTFAFSVRGCPGCP
jgi:hypothetical protein